jgi:hypothetical protein
MIAEKCRQKTPIVSESALGIFVCADSKDDSGKYINPSPELFHGVYKIGNGQRVLCPNTFCAFHQDHQKQFLGQNQVVQ